MGYNRIAAIDDLCIIAAFIEHTHIKTQHIGKIYSPSCTALIRTDDHHVITVNL